MALKLPKINLPFGKKAAAEVPISLDPSGDAAAIAPAPMEMASPPTAGTKRAFRLPIIGKLPFAQQLKYLGLLVLLLLVFLALTIYVDVQLASNGTARVEVTGNTLMHSQRLAKAVPPAVSGNPPAFDQLRDSRDTINANLERLLNGNKTGEGVRFDAPNAAIQNEITKIREEWARTEKNATTVLDQQAILTTFGATITRINAQNPVLLELTEQIANQKLQLGAPAREIATASQLVMLTQRLAKNANELLSGEGVNPETAFLLGKDTNTFKDMLDGLLNGSESLRLAPAKDEETREKLAQLKEAFDTFQKSVSNILTNLQKIVAAKQAQQAVFQDNEQLRGLFEGLQQSFNAELSQRNVNFAIMVVLGLLIAALLAAIAVAFAADNGVRAEEAERRQRVAELQEADAKSTNDQNQAAILRLMNELQEVADGNLTVQATVTEDITGAIADSVNYTVEELRTLVARINRTAEQVTDATTKAQDQSSKLLASATEQSREIKQTGESVLRMASAINEVSTSAAESANVARKSLAAAEDGQRAVQNAIAGMDGIRDQIQETSKRIKRLGESSQEIGEIIELISDITEQTNVLALNAAIQAASAGEAGRGFTVVAEEVQRLADRSGEAAKQIGALVRTIQTDTQDAVAAMEKSTAGVVEGAKLSDAAGQSLTNIGAVSKQLTELIESISRATSTEASNANQVARSIEHILTVNEQTSSSTQQTAAEIKQLAMLAQELKSSVARFRVS